MTARPGSSTELTGQAPPEPADAAFEREVERHYRHNAMVNVLDGTFFWFGASFMATRTILPLYVSHFTDSALVIGLLSVLASTGWLLPQLFTANWIQRLPRKKVAIVHVGLFTERLPVFLMVPAAWLATRSSALALVLFFVYESFVGFKKLFCRHLQFGDIDRAGNSCQIQCAKTRRKAKYGAQVYCWDIFYDQGCRFPESGF